ncbi:MAG: Prevent host death protein, Phd antitoxin [uncultured Thermomicrobiales bacterium]|uniref:Antitoxin n=1 Tax=uncultured Thermomicrobiales bacterium TaxID=1645740 RepID=A0A6J4TFK8_9BACT|nr:MAG: Prevent host death protein, Phd antitoxin [uncultured Thermomicrobiales bacterium]
MKTVGSYEAKTHLPRLLAAVAKGETFTITKHGVPVAELGPPRNGTKPDVEAMIAAWEETQRRENITLGGLSIREMIDEGRRF